ncbi:efflux RND transporter periplasmic adaptor subunit [Thalassotalea psychrophila]|uniref:Efflux RND transporter periplasmic adaptor subunit n=1 Tax=Thalassotalea psychrophila TaxID=3065647 RepID=A0ABY9TVZ2_9GAMM|nr:efflux RND transporter periplasmic adaptor subunit [Colwelliaceae bacterium SQ149]
MTQLDVNTTQKKKSKIKLILMPFLIILVGVLGSGAMKLMATKPDKKDMEVKPPLVNVIDIQAGDVTFSIASQGSVVPRTETILISEVSGQIINVSPKLRVGGYFAKGEMMLEIDPITYDVNVLQAESRLESMQAALIQEQAQAEQAKQEWGMTGKPLEQAPLLALRIPQLHKAQADVKAAEADLKEAQIKLKRTKITAPYDALLTEKYVDIGQYVSTNGQLAKTLAIDFAEVRLPIKQTDIAYLDLPKLNEMGDKSRKLTISSSQAGKQLHWDSFITRYEGVVNSQSRVHYIVAQIDDPYNLVNDESDIELRIGMFVNANIQGKTAKDIVVLPRETLHGANTVYLAKADNTLSLHNVNIVRTDAENVYVENNFSTTDRVILTGLRTPVEGMPIRVAEDLSGNEQSVSTNIETTAK